MKHDPENATIGSPSEIDRLRRRIAELEAEKEERRRVDRVRSALARVSSALIRQASIEEMSEVVLDAAKELTGSPFGYIGYIDPTTGHLVCPTMTRDIWEICRVPDKDVVFKRFCGLWGWVLKNKTALLTNDPAADDRSTGLPEGHIPIRRFCSAPALIGDRLVGQIALANAPRDYVRSDLSAVEELAELYSVAVHRIYQERELEAAATGLERRVAERTAALKTSEKRFRRMFDQSPIGAAIVGLDYRFVQVNPELCRITGYAEDELMDKGFPEITHPEDLQKDIEQVEALAAGRIDAYQMEKRYIRKDGSSIWVRLWVRLIRDDDGTPLYYLPVIEDISEAKRTEEALRHSEQRYREFFERAPFGIFHTSVEGRYLTVNPALARMLGYETPEAVMENISDIAGQVYVDPERRRQMLEMVAEGGELKTHESVFYRRDGTKWIGRVQLRQVDDPPGRAPFLQGFVEDLTARRQAEASLQQSERILRHLSNQLIAAQESERRRIAAELHDQFGQDLLSLKLALRSVQAGLESWQTTLAARCEALLSAIDRLSEEMRRLSKDLSPAILEDLGLSVALQWLVREFSRNHGIAVDTHLDELPEAFAQDEEILVYRILQEALTNIGRHAGADRVSVKAEGTAGGLQIVVEDNGCGFDAESLRTERAHERGLGLTVMAERARMLGGTVHIESRPGRGARLTLTAPAKEGR